MNTKVWVGGVIALLIVAGLSWLAWRSQMSQGVSADRVTVAATIFPIASLVEQIGREHITVVLLIPPGVTEHSNALTPQQLQVASQARAIFQIGHALDTSLTAKVKGVVPQAEVITVDRGITLQDFGETRASGEEEHEEDHRHDTGVDPHYWLTVPNAIHIAQTIRDELQKIDPEHRDDYAQNFTELFQDLQQLETELQQTAKGITPKQFIAMHNAWSYLAPHYGLELVGTYEPTEGRDPSLQDLQHLQELVRRYTLKTFYAEPQKASSAVTRLMQQELGLQVMVLDPVGGTENKESYQAVMRSTMNTLMAGAQ